MIGNDKTFLATAMAVEAIKAALEKRKTPDAALRVGVKGGKCLGYTYAIEFCDNDPREKDLVFEFDGVQIIIDKKSIIYLNGAELDFEETFMKKGFKFNNPIVKGECGCQSSFSVGD